jgi:hypothetical protein
LLRLLIKILLPLAGTALCLHSPAVVSSEAADVVIINARAFSADHPGQFAEALAIRGNRILAVGTGEEIAPLRGETTQVIDAHGATVMPGFNDAHVHFLSGSLGLGWVQLLDAETFVSIQDRIRSFAATHPDQPWVLGRGWLYGAFPGGLPTRQQLDALIPDRPAVMECYDGHTKWLNSKALEAAGITAATPDPVGGQIVRDTATGEPTGVLKESAQALIDHTVPQPGREEKLAALRQGVALAHRLGVTGVQEAGADAEELELFDVLRRAGELQIRMYMALSAGPGFAEADLKELERLRYQYPDSDTLRLGAVKLYADGVVESHTAALLAPYANRETRGNLEFTPGEMNRIVTLLDARGWQVLIHAIGDGAIRMALDAYETAQKTNPPPSRGRRHRIEHIEAISAEDIPRFARLGVIASMQPFHASPNQNILEVWAVNLGPERAARAWSWKGIRDAGGRLAFGTDWPVVELDPRPGIHTALTRKTAAGLPEGGFMPGQRLPLHDVLEAYTSGTAYAAFDEGRVGTLAPGKLADIVIWSADLFALPVDQVKDAEVRMTLFDGRIVYASETEP